MLRLVELILNCGVKTQYQTWQIHLTRKLNAIALVSSINGIVAIAFCAWLGINDFLYDFLFVICLSPVIVLFNFYKNYVWSIYFFFFCSICVTLPILTLKMGLASNIYLFYFPVVISLVQILGRKELVKHLMYFGIIIIVTVFFLGYGIFNDLLHINFPTEIVFLVSIFNLILSLVTTIIFTLIITKESIAQETKLNTLVKEKDLLLAEVFHRVKNNMNIVTSLLNLKKNMADSCEVKSALEDCQNRIYSMALVHNTIYRSKDFIGLNFKAYVQKLVHEISTSLGHANEVEIVLKMENTDLDLVNAIPCGLILNELITNSFKYAKEDGKILVITIDIQKNDNTIVFQVSDNGPGILNLNETENSTLGIELIKSLTEQIDGMCSFSNDNGLKFTLTFQLKHEVKLR